ncbi:MAG: hypothetical protein IKD77_04460 [Bacilli bacterium]|nr:hypothetical protein [Bacilli bacterium]
MTSNNCALSLVVVNSQISAPLPGTISYLYFPVQLLGNSNEKKLSFTEIVVFVVWVFSFLVCCAFELFSEAEVEFAFSLLFFACFSSDNNSVSSFLFSVTF